MCAVHRSVGPLPRRALPPGDQGPHDTTPYPLSATGPCASITSRDHATGVTTTHPHRADDAAMLIPDMFPDAPAPTRLSTHADRLIDELLDCHDEWLEDVAAVDETYQRWRAAPVAERPRCHGAYLAALDQEEA